MATIRPRPNSDGTVTWQVRFRHEGRETSKPFVSEKAASRWARILERVGPTEALNLLSMPSRTTAPTLTDWLTHHLEHATNITDGTRGEYRRLAARSWLTELGDLPVDVITKDAVKRWVRAYADGHSAKTLANAHGLLSTVLASAVESGHRPDNPAKGIKLPDGQRQEMVFLTPGEFARLFDKVPERWQPLVLTAAGTGLRWGEITALHWRDVDLDADRPMIHVRQAFKRGATGTRHLGTPKTRRSRRSISLPPEVVRVLDPLRDEPGTLVFRAEKGGRLHHQAWHPRVWTPAVEAANLGKRPRFHDLRHSHVAWQAAGGAMPGEIQARLGHESIKTTMDVYGHLFPGAHDRTAAIASLALTGAMPELES